MSIISYTVIDGDSLPNIALRILGSAAKWLDIAAFNKLHSPYISNSILDYYGTAISQGTFPTALSNGQEVLSLSPIPEQATVDIGGILLVGQYDTNAEFSYDILIIRAYNGTDGTITVAGGLTRDYDSRAHWFLYPIERPTKVVRTGDTLYIPNGTLPIIRTTDRYVDSFGTDIAMDSDGLLQWSNVNTATGSVYIAISGIISTPVDIPAGTKFRLDNTEQLYQTTTLRTIQTSGLPIEIPIQSLDNGLLGSAEENVPMHLVASSAPTNVFSALVGATVRTATPLQATFRPADIATVSGGQNVAQALLNRLSTQIGELSYHPDYGNRAFDYIGLMNNGENSGFIEAWTIESASRETRIDAILGGRVIRDADSVRVILSARTTDRGEKILIDNLILRFIGDN